MASICAHTYQEQRSERTRRTAHTQGQSSNICLRLVTHLHLHRVLITVALLFGNVRLATSYLPLSCRLASIFLPPSSYFAPGSRKTDQRTTILTMSRCSQPRT